MKKRKKFDSAKQRLQGTDVPVFPPPTKQHKETPYKSIAQSKWREKQAELAKGLNSVRKKSDSLPVKPSDHEQCIYCERYFGPKAYDRHTEWCKEQHTKLKNSSNVNQEAKERLQVRTKYRAPLSNKVLTRDKYLPRSRDPSPMSLSRTEGDESTKHKLPSPGPLNRTASLRMNGRSKSMLHRSPSIPPAELRDAKLRAPASSVSIRREIQPKETERASVTHAEPTKPKIVSSSQSTKKVLERSKSKTHTLRKCRSWTSQQVIPELVGGVEELQVYSCVLHPLEEKRSQETSLSVESRKRSVSMSKSHDTLQTYIVHPIQDQSGTEGEILISGCSMSNEDETSEMISDDILYQSDSWRKLPPVLKNAPNDRPMPTSPRMLSIEYVPPEIVDRVTIVCQSDLSESLEEHEETWEVNEDVLNYEAEKFMAWLKHTQSRSTFKPFQRFNTSETMSQVSNEEPPDYMFMDSPSFFEPNESSECLFSENIVFVSPTLDQFVRIESIVEINDVGTTVDDLEEYIAKQKSEVMTNKNVVHPDDGHCLSKNATNQKLDTAPTEKVSSIFHIETPNQDQIPYVYSMEESIQAGKLEPKYSAGVYIVDECGSLKSLRHIDFDNSYGVNNSASSCHPLCLASRKNKDSREFLPSDHLSEASAEGNTLGAKHMYTPQPTIVNCSMNELIAMIIDVKNEPAPFHADKIACNGLTEVEDFKYLPLVKSKSQELIELGEQLMCQKKMYKDEGVQVDLPCLKCLMRDEDVAAKTSWRELALERRTNQLYWIQCREPEFDQDTLSLDEMESELDSQMTADSLDLSKGSDWQFSETPCSYDSSNGKQFVRKKRVKYVETIEYCNTQKGPSTTKTLVKELPPLKNVPRNIPKSVKRDVLPVVPEPSKECRTQGGRFVGSRECLTLPPIKRRFERRP